MKKRIKLIIEVLIAVIFIIAIIWLYRADFSKDKKIEYGVSFSAKYAKELGLNPYLVLKATLDELGVKNFRLMAYWDEIEKIKGQYNFTNLDWQIKEIGKREGKVVLSVGHRLPRWPECHWPDWTYKLNQTERQKEVEKFIITTVNRYKEDPVITAWQVENEPFLKVFGECPKPDLDFYKQEIKLVKSLDSRPIIATESGELSTWLKASKIADLVGTSVYRITWNKLWGYFYYPLPPAYYYLKAQIIKFLTPVDDIFVSEMQMEPWLGMPVVKAPLDIQYKSMNAKQFQKNFEYIKKTGLSPIYMWGVEWWYWLKEQGDVSIWNLAKKIF